MLPNTFREVMTVRYLRWHAPDVFELCLDREGLSFMPGDCLALFAGDGRVSRPYSIASGTDDEDLRFVIRHMPEGVVSSFLSTRQPGDAVRVSPPFGWFRPGEHAEHRPFVFMATGTGVAPFLSFLYSFPRVKPKAMLYGVRRAADLVRPEWLIERAGAHIAVSREPSPGYYHGRITGLLEEQPIDADADYYLCGLDVMIDEVTRRLELGGVPITRIHRECFFNASYDG